MKDEEFNARLRELIREIANLPEDKQKQLGSLASETKQRHQDIKKEMSKIATSLCDLRICLKYLLFDLEATRRERDKLKAIVDNYSPPDEDQPNQTDNEV